MIDGEEGRSVIVHNPALNRTFQHAASTWRTSARPAG